MTLLREPQRLGLAATFHIGVRKDVDDLAAHAWVQVGDVVVNDDAEVVGAPWRWPAGSSSGSSRPSGEAPGAPADPVGPSDPTRAGPGDAD